jgi:transposase
MYGVDKRAEVRAAHAAGRAIKHIMRQMQVSRRFVRKALREPTAEAAYSPRKSQPMPKLGVFAARLDQLLDEDAVRSKKDRLRLTRMHDLLQREGFDGSYDAVRRYAHKHRRVSKPTAPNDAFVPLSFPPGDAFQFDFSHEFCRAGRGDHESESGACPIVLQPEILSARLHAREPGDGV